MYTDFLPTQQIPVSQLFAWNSRQAFPLELDLNHRGCVIRDRVSGAAFLASIDDEGFIRGATLLADKRDHLAFSLLSEMTGCEWVNEYSKDWPLYRCWTKEERDLKAREVAEALAQDRADAEGIEFTAAFEIEYCAAYEMHPITIMKWQVAA